MKNFLVVILLLFLCFPNFVFADNIGKLSALQESKIAAALEQQVFSKYGEEEIVQIYTTLKNESHTNSTPVSAMQQYILLQFEKKQEVFLSKSMKNIVQESKNNKKDTMLQQVNRIRAQYGLQTLVVNKDLETLAMKTAKKMHDNNFLEHTHPDGLTFKQRIEGIGYDYGAGENIARGYDDITELMTDWMGSSSHRYNIVYADFSELGIGYYNGYWVQVFGVGS